MKTKLECQKEQIKPKRHLSHFLNLKNQLKQQELMQKGHLLELQDLVQQLLELHYQLLKTDANYVTTFHSAKPHLLEAVEAAQTEEVGNEIQICLNGVYGLLLCRLLGKNVSDRQLEAADAFGNVLSHLNFSYQQRIFMTPN